MKEQYYAFRNGLEALV